MNMDEANNLPVSRAAKTLLDQAGANPTPGMLFLTQLARLQLDQCDDRAEEQLASVERLAARDPIAAVAAILHDENPETAEELMALGPERAGMQLLDNLVRAAWQPEPTRD